MRFPSERWDRHFLSLALKHAEMSKDPSTKVGAVIVGPDREIVSVGFNGFPRGIEDSPERLNNRETKLKLMVHAEINACMACARIGTSSKHCTIYVAGDTWRGPPCTRCTVEIIQAGITEVVALPFAEALPRWRGDLITSLALLKEAGIRYREIAFSP